MARGRGGGGLILSAMWHVQREIDSRYLQKAPNRTSYSWSSAVAAKRDRGAGLMATVANSIIKLKRSLSWRLQSGRTPLYIAARGSFTAIVDMIIKTARLDYPTPVGTHIRQWLQEFRLTSIAIPFTSRLVDAAFDPRLIPARGLSVFLTAFTNLEFSTMLKKHGI